MSKDLQEQLISNGEKLTAAIKPLMDEFDFAFVSYARYYPDGSMLLLATNGNIVAETLQKGGYLLPTAIMEPGVHLISTYLSQDNLQSMRETQQYEPGAILIIDSESYREQMSFLLKLGKGNLVNRYVNDPGLLHKFRFGFKKSAKEIIHKASQQRFVAPTNTRNEELLQDDNDKLDNLKNLKLGQYTFFTDKGETLLSQREMECLMLMLQLKPSKSIASILNISERTVTFHIQNIYDKFGCNSRSGIYAIAMKNGLLGVNKEFFSNKD